MHYVRLALRFVKTKLEAAFKTATRVSVATHFWVHTSPSVTTVSRPCKLDRTERVTACLHGTYICNLCGGILSAIITVSSCSRNLGINISKKLLRCDHKEHLNVINRLTPNDPYMGRTAPLTSKRCNLYIYSTNICTEYFKHALYFPFSSLQNAVCFIMLTLLVPVLFTFYKEDVLKLKKK